MELTINLVDKRVSVIVPVYNAEAFLQVCVDSVLNQSYQNLELILINDGSSDASLDLCQANQVRDSRMQVLDQKNQGPAAARNAGLAIATGAYVLFLDADDTLEVQALELLVHHSVTQDVDFVIGDFCRTKNGQTIDSKGLMSESCILDKKELVEYGRSYLKKPNRFLMFAYAWGRLFKTQVIRKHQIGFNASLHTFEDVAFNFEYLKHVDRAYYVHESLYNHIIHDGYASATMTLSGDPLRMFGYIPAVGTIGDFLSHNGLEAYVEKEVGHCRVYLTIIQLVRMCGQIGRDNWSTTTSIIRQVMRLPEIRRGLKYYTASKGESQWIPRFIYLQMVWPIVFICKYKAYKRYGRMKKQKGS